MSEYILILTLMIGVGGGNTGQGSGGLAMGAFDDKQACEFAAAQWIEASRITRDRNHQHGLDWFTHSALCVPRGSS